MGGNLFAQKIALLAGMLLQSVYSAGQQPGSTSSAAAESPLEYRQVSGIVRDTMGAVVTGVSVKLVSAKDSIATSTDQEGIFIFDNIRMATFVLTISRIGFATIVRKYLNNDLARNVVLNPIIISERSQQLEEITIKAGSFHILQKVDTVEYRASDYKVREGATIDELLKLMEGMDVSNNGAVTHNAAPVTKARLNGKDFNNGNVAATIQNLPAEIVDKIQIIDDYGNMAARTGIKNGSPAKTLNITTRTDKSVGSSVRANAGLGTNTQVEGSTNLSRVNRNKTLSATGAFFKTPNGVAGSSRSVGGGLGNGLELNDGSTTASGGTDILLRPSLSYHNDWGNKLSLLANYGLVCTDNTSQAAVMSQWFSTLGTTNASQNAGTYGNSRIHRLNLEIEYNIDNSNYIQFRPSVSINASRNGSISTLRQNGLVHKDQLNRNLITVSQLSFAGTIDYQHIWLKKLARTFAAEATIGGQKNDNDADQSNNIKYYRGSSAMVLKDSVVNRVITTDNMQNSYRLSMTYAEPVGKFTRLEFNSTIERRDYDNARLTSKAGNAGLPLLIDSLSNTYKYSFSQYRNSINFRHNSNSGKYDLSLGLTAVAASLNGTKTSTGSRTDQNYFKLIPIARFGIKLSALQLVSFHYTGRATEPDFNQLQPVRDISNPQNILVGNPYLKVSFIHTVTGQYSNYVPNSRLTYSGLLRWTFTGNQVSSNIIQIKDDYNSLKNETHYVNISGNYSRSAEYTISKTLVNRAYRIDFSGNVINTQITSMSNNTRNKAVTLGFRENLGLKITPKTWLEITPHLLFDFSKTNYSLLQSTDIVQRLWSMNAGGKFFFLKKMEFNYLISKNYISGLGLNQAKNPLVINTMLQTKLNARVALQLRAFDLFNQNNFLKRNITANSVTESSTNPNSRYFILNLSVNFQKWTAAKERNGQTIRRRGDGSFIN